METFMKIVVVLGTVLAIVTLVAMVMGFPTMWLMNYLFAPSFLELVFGVAKMTFWKAFWVNILAGILVKSSSSSSNSN